MSTQVTLTDQELVMLDGKVSAEVQSKVEAAKSCIETQSRLSHINPKPEVQSGECAFGKPVITQVPGFTLVKT
jgi:hypothetical protein